MDFSIRAIDYSRKGIVLKLNGEGKESFELRKSEKKLDSKLASLTPVGLC